MKSCIHDQLVKSCILKYVILISLISLSDLQAQQYYYNGSNGLEILTISGNSCTSTLVGPFFEIGTGNSVGTGDIAICPNGDMYVVGGNLVWEVNPNTGGVAK